MKLTLMVLIKYLCMVFCWLRIHIDHLDLFSSLLDEDEITKYNLGNLKLMHRCFAHVTFAT